MKRLSPVAELSRQTFPEPFSVPAARKQRTPQESKNRYKFPYDNVPPPVYGGTQRQGGMNQQTAEEHGLGTAIRNAFLSLPVERRNELFAELGDELLSRNDPTAIRTINRLADQARIAEDSMLGENHPLASSAGAFKDDPFWNETMAIMRRFREPISLEDDSSEQRSVSP